MELLLWISTLYLAVMAIPEAFRSAKFKKNTIGLFTGILWFVGEFTGLIYAITQDYMLMATFYIPNVVALFIIGYYGLKAK